MAKLQLNKDKISAVKGVLSASAPTGGTKMSQIPGEIEGTIGKGGKRNVLEEVKVVAKRIPVVRVQNDKAIVQGAGEASMKSIEDLRKKYPKLNIPTAKDAMGIGNVPTYRGEAADVIIQALNLKKKK